MTAQQGSSCDSTWPDTWNPASNPPSHPRSNSFNAAWLTLAVMTSICKQNIQTRGWVMDHWLHVRCRFVNARHGGLASIHKTERTERSMSQRPRHMRWRHSTCSGSGSCCQLNISPAVMMRVSICKLRKSAARRRYTPVFPCVCVLKPSLIRSSLLTDVDSIQTRANL